MFHRRWLSISLAVVLGSAPAFPANGSVDSFTPQNSSAKPAPSKKRKKKSKPAPAIPEDLIEPLVAKPGWIWVELAAPVRGAHVYLDGKDMGSLPLDSPLSIPAGVHLVMAKRLGYQAFEQRVDLKPGAAIEVLARLEPILAVLAVRSDVVDSEVFIDGTHIGRTPLEDFVLEPGPHEIRVQRSGYQPTISKLHAKAGAEYTVAARLQKLGVRPNLAEGSPQTDGSRLFSSVPAAEASASSQPWYGHWYVWAGAGAVVAVTVGVVLLTRNQPLHVCHHNCDATIPALVNF